MKFAVLGAGAMGSTMASCLLKNGHEVRLWFTAKDRWILPKVQDGAPHPLSGADLRRARLCAPTQIKDSLDGADAQVVACSSEGLVGVVGQVLETGGKRLPALVVTKGFVDFADIVTTVSERLGGGVLPHYSLLGGPMIASEVAAGHPAGGIVAVTSRRSREAARGLRSARLSLAETEDVRGVELCAALKNVYAILVGIAETRGANLRALAFARALEEMTEVVVKLGGEAETVSGPAGSGDLYVTSLAGRNGEFGRRVGQGEPPRRALAEMEAAGKTVEGARASLLGSRYIRGHGRKAPLVDAVASVCHGKSTVEDAVSLILER